MLVLVCFITAQNGEFFKMSNLQGIQNFPVNPISGTYGSGKIQLFSSSGTFTRPTGVTNVRARCFGGGGVSGGGGGGFAIKEINSVTATVTVTVGASGGTSSFGAYVSATGGTSNGPGAGGAGSGGDYNSTGGGGALSAGGGVASIWGNGGPASGASPAGSPGASGGGVNAASPARPGLFGSGASNFNGTGGTVASATQAAWNSIDFIGTGGGGNSNGQGQNGGGAGYDFAGYPGGGGATLPSSAAPGLVIVEY